jgi:hypothetical protein
MAYTDDQLIADVDWLYGGYDQFQVDDVRKQMVIDALADDHARAVRVLSAYAKTLLVPPFTIEDVVKFIEFLESYLDYSL